MRRPACSLLTDSLIQLIALVISRISSATECRVPWGGTRATQITDVDDVLDRFDGAKRSCGSALGTCSRVHSRPRCEPLPTSIALSGRPPMRDPLTQDLEDVQCRRRSRSGDHLHISCDARAGNAQEEDEGLAWSRWSSGSIWPPSAMHAAFNQAMGRWSTSWSPRRRQPWRIRQPKPDW
jgi:hypothetical protein